MEITIWLQLAPVSAAVFAITLVTSVMDFLQGFSVRPRFILSPYLVVHRKEYHRLFTGALVHGDWLHLFINLLVFYSFAPVVEVLVGHWQLFVIYWGSELVATIPDIVQHRNNAKYASLGASGAISGLTFCYILHLPLSDILLFFAIPMPAWLFGVLYLAYSHFAARRQWDHVNHNAHLYGAIGGLLFTAMIAPEALSNFARQLGL